MKTGLLWFAGKEKGKLKITTAQVEKAAEFYEKKYGARPNVCFVNPGEVDAGPDGIQVEADRKILPGHLWLGIKEG